MRLTWLLLSFALVACDSPAPSRWHVADGHLRAPDGRAVVLRGVNLANAHKHPPYLSEDSAEEWHRLREEFGFNAVRFLITWSAIEPEAGQYDEAYLYAVRERLTWAADAGIVVVLDMHQDVYGEGFGFDGAPRWTCDESRYEAFQPRETWFLSNLDPNVVACVDGFYGDPAIRARFIAAWRHVAARLSDMPAVIGFDPLNEPVWGSHALTTYEQDLLMPLYRDVVTAVRREASDWVAFIEPGASRNAGFPTTLTAFDFRDVVYAPHAYDIAAESGNGFDPARREAILEHVAELREEATELGAALWIGEYGGSSSAPGLAEYMDADYDAFASVAASSMYWAYDRDDGYGFLAPDGSVKPALAESLVRPYPERVAGDPIAWTWDDASSTFTFTFVPDRAVDAPTEIVVPARSYPSGYDVECGGCEVERVDGVLRLLTPPPGETVEVTLSPSAG